MTDSFAERLVRLMHAKGLRQRDLVRVLGASRPTVSAWVNRGQVPDVPRLRLLAEALGCKMDDLVGEGQAATKAGRPGRRWLIWSEEHGMWWTAGRASYTTSMRAAGRYTFAEAYEIVEGANRYLPEGQINELLMPDPWP